MSGAGTDRMDRARLVPGHPRDVALVAAVAFFQVVGSTGASRNQPDRLDLDGLAYGLLLAGPALLLLRRRHPVTALAGVLGVTVTYYGLGYPYGPAFVSLVIALVHAVLSGHRTAAWALAGGGLVAYGALAWVVDDASLDLATVTGHSAALVAVLALAEVARLQRARVGEERRARAETERRRAGEQRLRLARELHDVLGHNVSLINVQASTALHLMDRRPEQARIALEAIKAASKEMLAETRRALDVLRGDEDGAPRSPAPGLDRLPDLVSRCATAGLHVTVTSRGALRPLAPASDLAAYRIVQEALTNVLRHAGAEAAEVLLDHQPDALVVTVTDDGPGASGAPEAGRTDGGGAGLWGLRERAAAVGGRLSAGPRPGGGFVVSATLPWVDTATSVGSGRIDDPGGDT